MSEIPLDLCYEPVMPADRTPGIGCLVPKGKALGQRCFFGELWMLNQEADRCGKWRQPLVGLFAGARCRWVGGVTANTGEFHQSSLHQFPQRAIRHVTEERASKFGESRAPINTFEVSLLQ